MFGDPQRFKFRVFYRGKMYYKVMVGEYSVHLFLDNGEKIEVQRLFEENLHIMQSTGLTDALGREIYEGDIYDIHHFKWKQPGNKWGIPLVIRWDQHMLSFGLHSVTRTNGANFGMYSLERRKEKKVGWPEEKMEPVDYSVYCGNIYEDAVMYEEMKIEDWKDQEEFDKRRKGK